MVLRRTSFGLIRSVVDGSDNMHVERVLQDGSALDTSFNSTGTLTMALGGSGDAVVNAIAFSAHGWIVLAGAGDFGSGSVAGGAFVSADGGTASLWADGTSGSVATAIATSAGGLVIFAVNDSPGSGEATLEAFAEGSAGSGYALGSYWATTLTYLTALNGVAVNASGAVVAVGTSVADAGYWAVETLHADGTDEESFSLGCGPEGSGGGAVDMVVNAGNLSVVISGYNSGNFIERLGNGAVTRIYFQADANYNITSSADVAGGVLRRYILDAYGTVNAFLDASFEASCNVEGVVNFFQGGRRDTVSGDYQFENRWYSPTLMIWQSADPTGTPDGADRYAMEAANPINFTDYSGLSREDEATYTDGKFRIPPAGAKESTYGQAILEWAQKEVTVFAEQALPNYKNCPKEASIVGTPWVEFDGVEMVKTKPKGQARDPQAPSWLEVVYRYKVIATGKIELKIYPDANAPYDNKDQVIFTHIQGKGTIYWNYTYKSGPKKGQDGFAALKFDTLEDNKAAGLDADLPGTLMHLPDENDKTYIALKAQYDKEFSQFLKDNAGKYSDADLPPIIEERQHPDGWQAGRPHID